MSFQSPTYAEALEKRQNKPQKPRKPIKRRSDKAIRAQKAAGDVFPVQTRKRSTLSRKASPTKAAKKKKTKKLSVGNLKKKCWTQFSIFIRTRGADSDGWNTCVTCGVRKFWRELQAGHFIRGRLNANLFDERGVHPQCYSCNVGKQGDVVTYYRWMAKEHGDDVINELLLQNSKTRKWQGGELQFLLERYSALNAANPLTEKSHEDNLP